MRSQDAVGVRTPKAFTVIPGVRSKHDARSHGMPAHRRLLRTKMAAAYQSRVVEVIGRRWLCLTDHIPSITQFFDATRADHNEGTCDRNSLHSAMHTITLTECGDFFTPLKLKSLSKSGVHRGKYERVSPVSIV